MGYIAPVQMHRYTQYQQRNIEKDLKAKIQQSQKVYRPELKKFNSQLARRHYYYNQKKVKSEQQVTGKGLHINEWL
ncbi:hypothetical protein ACLIA0_03585 [Bacillaceae bacterium W0354]